MLFHRIMLHEEKDMLVCTVRFLSARQISKKRVDLSPFPLDAGLLLLVANKPRSEISIIGTEYSGKFFLKTIMLTEFV